VPPLPGESVLGEVAGDLVLDLRRWLAGDPVPPVRVAYEGASQCAEHHAAPISSLSTGSTSTSTPRSAAHSSASRRSSREASSRTQTPTMALGTTDASE